MTNTEHIDLPTATRDTGLIFGLEANPPFQTAILVALQHVCVIFVPSVTPAILIGRALNLDAASISYIIGMTLLVAGFATFVQARRIGSIGSGLLSIQGPSFAFLPPIFRYGIFWLVYPNDSESLFAFCQSNGFTQIFRRSSE